MLNITSFDTSIITSILIILSYFLIGAFAYYIPLYALFRDKEKVSKVIIPISISSQIIFGYLFYIFEVTKYYPISYLIFLAALNTVAIIILKSEINKLLKQGRKFNKLWLLIIFLPVIYSRFYDAVVFNAPGNPDALAHLTMLKEISTHGVLSNFYYAPGFHLLLLPLTYLVPDWDISRYAGSFLGLLTILTAFLLLKNNLKHKLSSILLILLLCFPAFDRLGLQTIGFFPSAITFIFMPLILYFTSKPTEFDKAQARNVLIVAIVALAITVPYFLVPLLFGMILIYPLVAIFRFKAEENYRKFMRNNILLLLVGFFVAFGHVYLFTKTLHQQGGFPEIPTIQLSEDKPTTGSNKKDNFFQLKSFTEKYQNRSEFYYKIPVILIKSDFYQSMMVPMLGTGVETIQPKNILGFDNFLQIGAWLYLVIFVSLIIYSIKTRNNLLLTISTLGLLFGISTQTGIFEMSYYRGRAGWYYNFLMLISLAYIFDLIYKNKYFATATLAMILLGVSAVYKPAIFPRLFYPETYAFANKIAIISNSDKVEIVANEGAISLTSNKLILQSVKIENLADNGKEKYIILNKKPFDRAGLLANMIFSPEKDIVLSNQDAIRKQKEVEIARTQAIKDSEAFEQYELFTESANIEVFKLKINSNQHTR